MTHSFTATVETFWIAHQEGSIQSGTLDAGDSIDTGADHLETYADPREWQGRLVKLREDYPAALSARLETVRLRDPYARINPERERRLDAGSNFAVPGLSEPIPLTGRPMDQSVYLALLMRAQGAKAMGVTDPVLTVRDAADAIQMLTPDQMIALVVQAMGWFEAVMKVSWAMKDGEAPFENGPPDDLENDEYWP